MTLDHGTKTLRELHESKATNIGIYSTDEKGRAIVTTADFCSLQKYVDELLEIELEDGSIIKCTPDHKFRLIDGSYKEAQYLTEDDELLSVERKVDKDHHFWAGYEFVKSNTESYFRPTHKLTARYLRESNPGKYDSSYNVVHHNKFNYDKTSINYGFDKLDNNPENILLFKSKAEHLSYHATGNNGQFPSNAQVTNVLSILKTGMTSNAIISQRYKEEHGTSFQKKHADRYYSLHGQYPDNFIKKGQHLSVSTEFKSEDISKLNSEK
jgi:hypothetical protein